MIPGWHTLSRIASFKIFSRYFFSVDHQFIAKIYKNFILTLQRIVRFTWNFISKRNSVSTNVCSGNIFTFSITDNFQSASDIFYWNSWVHFCNRHETNKNYQKIKIIKTLEKHNLWVTCDIFFRMSLECKHTIMRTMHVCNLVYPSVYGVCN